MSTKIALGINAQDEATGYALASVNFPARRIVEILEVGIFEDGHTRNRGVPSAHDVFRRAKACVVGLQNIAKCNAVDLVAAELTATPANFVTFTGGVMIGVLAALDLSVVGVLPKEANIAATGKKSATDRELMAWAIELPVVGTVNWPRARRVRAPSLYYRGQPLARIAEFSARALAVVQAVLNNQQVEMGRKSISHGRISSFGSI